MMSPPYGITYNSNQAANQRRQSRLHTVYRNHRGGNAANVRAPPISYSRNVMSAQYTVNNSSNMATSSQHFVPPYPWQLPVTHASRYVNTYYPVPPSNQPRLKLCYVAAPPPPFAVVNPGYYPRCPPPNIAYSPQCADCVWPSQPQQRWPPQPPREHGYVYLRNTQPTGQQYQNNASAAFSATRGQTQFHTLIEVEADILAFMPVNANR